MLVIARQKHERILIGDDIEIVVVETGRTTVRIGVQAPRHVKVIRAEIDDLEEPEEG